MKTRRKSKQLARAAEQQVQEQVEHEEQASEPQTPGPSKVELSVSLPDDIDAEYLASVLPEVSLETPGPETIIALYRIVQSQASTIDATSRSLEDTRADLERKDVELDQLLQDKESSSRDVESELESVQKELKQVKQERDELASLNTSLQSQVTSLTNSQSSSSTEVDVLKRRVEETEREKRDLVGVVSRLKEDSVQRDEEIQTLRGSLKQARQEYQALETQLRELRSTENSTKFKLDSLSQQLQLAKDEAARATSELTTKAEEYTQYRHTKHAELAALQSTHDALVQTHASTQSTLKALQSAHSSQAQQLAQALARVQDLTGRLAEQEATYVAEAAGLRRLVSMMEEREAQAKDIVDGIEKEWAGIGEKAERREEELRQEAERERSRAEEAERRIDEMERVLESINRGEYAVPSPGRGMPQTPVRGGDHDLVAEGMMALSPAVAMASKVQRGGKTFTEVYSELIQLKDAYKQKTAEADHMDRTLQAVLAQIEERAPVLAQQRAEYERLRTEADQLSAQLADAISERDARSFEARETSQKLMKTTRENDLLQQQLNDLGRQLQVLLQQLGRLHDPSIPSDEDLEQDTSTQPAENAEEFISNNLVLFRSIPALQEQNQKLLKIVREMGEKMEREEQEYREELQTEQNEAIKEAHDAIQDLQQQLENVKRASEVKIQAYVKERDMLKEMRGRDERREPPAPRANGSATVASDSEIAQELAEVNSQFETYKLETSVDSSRLREDLISAQREIGQLGAALAKANAKLDFMTERQLMAQDQYNIQGRELDDLTKRHQQLYDRYTRIDIECNRVTEEYLSANGRIEQLRTECANLRAEKKISDNAVNRITEENKALSVERAHLADLMKNVQKMHSDLERSGENDRRRLESQIQMLDNQNQDLRKQLSEERESLRHVTMHKDVEVKDLQTRIEKQTHELASTRESLIKAETSQKHLEARCEDLSKQVQAKEEKLSVYERRPSSLQGVSLPAATDGMSREQQLEAEIADLRGALKVAEVDLASARNHAQQFQEISQANEEALSTLNASYDEYKASMDAEIAKHESNVAGLQARVQSAEAESNQSRDALAEMARKLEEEREAWTNDRKDLEATIIDLTTSEKTFAEDRTSRESAVREQEERVKAVEEKYNQTVLAHAESIRTIDELRQKLAEVQSSTRNNLVAAETAKAQLASSEASWTQQRQALEKEMADLTARSKELTEQNNMLHQHLESVTSQAARIRQAADATGAISGDNEITDETDAKLSELRAVIGYLRREKEILQMQLDLGKTENGRLRTQISRLTQDLEQTKTALSEERERAVAAAATDAQHADLVEKINQLTILRESNATLRVDSEAHAKRARELDSKVKTLTAELEPLREEARVAKAELEARNRDVTRLQEESSRWQARNAQLLSKYDRIDPSEVQALKETIERVQSEKAAMESTASSKAQEVQTLNQKIEDLNKALQSNKEIGVKNIRVFRQRMETFNTDMAAMKAKVEEAEAKLGTVTAERDALQAEKAAGAATMQGSEQEVEKLRQEKAALEEALQSEKSKEAPAPVVDTSELEAKIASLSEERDKLLAEMESLKQAPGAAPTPDSSQWEAEKAELLKSRNEALATVQTAKQESAKLKEEARNLKMSNDKFQARLHEQQQARQRLVEEHEAAVKAALEKAASEVQSTSADSAATADLVKQHTEELRNLEERLKAQHQEELQAAAAAKVKEAAPPSAGDQASIDAAIAAREAELRASHEQDVAKAMDNGRMEASMKLKIKDSQIVKLNARIKQLEQQLEELTKAGSPTQEEKPATPMTPAPSIGAAAQPSATGAQPAAAAAQPGAAGAHPGAVSTRGGRGGRGGAAAAPGRGGAVGSASALQPGRGRGRGAARGGIHIRGAAPAGAGAGAGAAGASTSAAGGVNIMGAAGKRAREEGDGSAPDSLAKRLKPADGGAGGSGGGSAGGGGSGGGGKPVTLQRNRVGPS